MKVIVLDDNGNKRTYRAEHITENLHGVQSLFFICNLCGNAIIHGQIYDKGYCLTCMIDTQKKEQGR